jgi:hypothetical protein
VSAAWAGVSAKSTKLLCCASKLCRCITTRQPPRTEQYTSTRHFLTSHCSVLPAKENLCAGTQSYIIYSSTLLVFVTPKMFHNSLNHKKKI